VMLASRLATLESNWNPTRRLPTIVRTYWSSTLVAYDEVLRLAPYTCGTVATRALDVLTHPTPKDGGFSGYACGNPLRSRLTDLPGPTAPFLVRRAGTYSSPADLLFLYTGEKTARIDRALPMPQARGLRAEGKRSNRGEH
jgi:hypothetical protein